MKKALKISLVSALTVLLASAAASAQGGREGMGKGGSQDSPGRNGNGDVVDGRNQWCGENGAGGGMGDGNVYMHQSRNQFKRDADGDGIANGQDPDFVHGDGFIDEDGDGICDLRPEGAGEGLGAGNAYGQDEEAGTGPHGSGEGDGSGEGGGGEGGGGDGSGPPEE